MNHAKIIVFVVVAILVGRTSFGQSDGSNDKFKIKSKSEFKLRPKLTLGGGTMRFMGEVGGQEASYSVLNSNRAFHIGISNEINSYLSVNLFGLEGNLIVNEFSTARRLNVKSYIRSGGFDLEYNFNNFYKQPRIVKPFISAGFAATEYLSKADLKDSEGRFYHYWDDGSIRDIAQAEVGDAVPTILRRDYTYETDLRNLNTEGRGFHDLRTFSVPLSAGIKLDMNKRFTIKMGATYHLTLTDNIDNVSPAGAELVKGNTRKDGLFYSYLSLTYDLKKDRFFKSQKGFEDEFAEEAVDVLGVDMDGDKDGVHDFIDDCLGTPTGIKVDGLGCPLDNDGDGVPDYRDIEPITLPGVPVDAFGIEVSDEDIWAFYKYWKGDIPSYKGVQDYKSVRVDESKAQKYYTLYIASDMDNPDQEEINRILSISDIETYRLETGNLFMVGRYKTVGEAVARKIALEEKNIFSDVMFGNKYGLADAAVEASVIEENIKTYLMNLGDGGDSSFVSILSQDAYDNISKTYTAEQEKVAKKIFRIQLGAYEYKLSEDVFGDVDDLFVIKGDDGYYRYVVGSYDNIAEAAKRKVDLLLEGYSGAFIMAYDQGSRVTLSDAGVSVSDASKDVTVDAPTEAFSVDKVHYGVNLGAFEGSLTTEVLNVFLKLGNIKPVKGDDGVLTYYGGNFKTKAKAQSALDDVLKGGILQAKLSGFANGNPISVSEADQLLGE